MKQVAGAIVVLAGAVLVAAGVLANALMEAANRSGEPGSAAIVAGVILGLIAFAIYLRGGPAQPRTESDSEPHSPRRPA